MKTLLTALLVAALAVPAGAEDPAPAFYEGMERVRADYRKAFAASLKTADKVTIYVVSFDDLIGGLGNNDPFQDGPDGIRVAPYGKRAKILGSKRLNKEERTLLLNRLAAVIAKPEHTGGAFCHYPIHGIRVHKAGKVVHDGTFCWGCSNFSFDYPEGAEWLDTDPELEAIFLRLLPIPQAEIDRFQNEYPALRSNGEPQR